MRVFLTQLANDRYSSWDIARLWGLGAYTVTILLRVYCVPTIRINNALREYVASSPAVAAESVTEERQRA